MLAQEKTTINLYNFWRIKSNKELYNKEEAESLRKAEENVKYAKEELEKCMKQY